MIKRVIVAVAVLAIATGAFAQGQVKYVKYQAGNRAAWGILEPGDVIFTGTPGTTQAMKPGDTFEVEIVGVTTLRNKVVAAKGAPTSSQQ